MGFMQKLVAANFMRERNPSMMQRIAIGVGCKLAMLIARLL